MDFAAPGCQFRHTRDLLSLLFTVAPEVTDDPYLVERSVLLTGVTPHTTPTDLLDLFPLKTDAAVVVRDYETGERAGLVVFANSRDCDRAIYRRAPRFRGRVVCYRACIKARAWQSVPCVLVDAACDHARRIATAELLRTLLPPAYIEGDSFIHMRCIFLRGDYTLSCLDEMLPAKGGVCAIVACKAQSIVVLVYDNADSAEEMARILIKDPRIRMYDSLMFPFGSAATVSDTAGAAAGEQLRGMIPSSFTQPDYLQRIVLFRGLDTEHCDAFHVARCLKIDGLEGLVIHRGQGIVLAMFSSSEDARLQLRETAETWISVFGHSLTCELVDSTEFVAAVAPDKPCVAQDEEQLQVLAEEDEEELVVPAGRPYPDVDIVTKDKVLDRIEKEMKACAPDDAERIAKVLIKYTVLSRPNVLCHAAFPDKATLLLGVHPTRNWDDLWVALSSYGGLDALSLVPGRRAALAVFKRRSAALKLLQEPLDSCSRIGFHNCQRVPGADGAAEIVDKVSAELFELEAELKLSQV